MNLNFKFKHSSNRRNHALLLTLCVRCVWVYFCPCLWHRRSWHRESLWTSHFILWTRLEPTDLCSPNLFSNLFTPYQRSAFFLCRSTLGSSILDHSILTLPLSFSLTDACQFPAAWTGLWFQKGVNTITINQKNMSEKGDCIDQTNYNYVLENRWVLIKVSLSTPEVSKGKFTMNFPNTILFSKQCLLHLINNATKFSEQRHYAAELTCLVGTFNLENNRSFMRNWVPEIFFDLFGQNHTRLHKEKMFKINQKHTLKSNFLDRTG